jgi:hypothetical protein
VVVALTWVALKIFLRHFWKARSMKKKEKVKGNSHSIAEELHCLLCGSFKIYGI